MPKNPAAQALVRLRFKKMTAEERRAWTEHLRRIAKKPRKRKKKV